MASQYQLYHSIQDEPRSLDREVLNKEEEYWLR